MMFFEQVVLVVTMCLGWVFAAYVVTQPHPVRAAFALIGVIACAAVHWAALAAPFLALLLLLIYLGAVMVFFLFIVMTLPPSIIKPLPMNLKSLYAPLVVAVVAAPPLAMSLTGRGLHSFENRVVPVFTEIGTHLFESYGVVLQYLAFGLFITMVVVVAIISYSKDRP